MKQALVPLWNSTMVPEPYRRYRVRRRRSSTIVQHVQKIAPDHTSLQLHKYRCFCCLWSSILTILLKTMFKMVFIATPENHYHCKRVLPHASICSTSLPREPLVCAITSRCTYEGVLEKCNDISKRTCCTSPIGYAFSTTGRSQPPDAAPADKNAPISAHSFGIAVINATPVMLDSFIIIQRGSISIVPRLPMTQMWPVIALLAFFPRYQRTICVQHL